MGFFIKTPCTANIADMTETGSGWHCGACDKTVRDLRHASDEQVAAWLEQGPLCGRGFADATGRLLLAGAFAALTAGSAAADAGGQMPTPEDVEPNGVGETCSDADGKAQEPGSGPDGSPGGPLQEPAGEVSVEVELHPIVIGGVGWVKPARQRRASRRADRRARREARQKAREHDTEEEDAD